jgi:hypothetical protein
MVAQSFLGINVQRSPVLADERGESDALAIELASDVMKIMHK